MTGERRRPLKEGEVRQEQVGDRDRELFSPVIVALSLLQA